MRNIVRRFYELLGEPLRPRERVALALLVVLLLASFVLPLWKISMEAPQYPEGLSMEIYPHTIVGGHDGADIREINILNHYIGMRKIDRADLNDLDWLPFAIGGLTIFTLRVAAIGEFRSLIDLLVLTGYVCIFSFARFVYKLYTYGHNLDPNAPVKVQGFTPALFGTRQIANFTTHSFPQLGAVCIALFVLSLAAVTVWHFVVSHRRARREEEKMAAAEGALVPT